MGMLLSLTYRGLEIGAEIVWFKLALSLGLGVSSAHRAMADVDTMSRILTRVHEMGHSLIDMFAKAMRPKVKVVADVSFQKTEWIFLGSSSKVLVEI